MIQLVGKLVNVLLPPAVGGDAERKWSSSKLESPLNVLVPRLVTVLGNVSFLSEMHEENALFPTVVTLPFIVTFCKEKQVEKSDAGIAVILLGKDMDLNE